MVKKIIVSGCTGQTGSYMVDYLLKNTDYEIFGMIRRSAKPDYSNLNKALGNPRFKFVVADLSDSQSIDNLVRDHKPDYFLNFAAQSFVGSSWQIPEQTFDTCAMGVLRILEAIRKHAPSCRFYNAGSSEEMGDVQYSPQNMAHPARARSPYGAAKIAARQIVKVYRESYNLYAIQGLLYNHESERRGEEFVTRKVTKGVARILRSIQTHQPITPIELGNLDAKRDWSHAEDFVVGIWRMMNQEQYREELKDETYSRGSILIACEVERKNIETLSPKIKEYILSSGETHTIREFVEKAFTQAGIRGDWSGSGIDETFRTFQHGGFTRDSKKLVIINPKYYRPAEVELLLGDSTDARKELGWKPNVSFEELVSRMVKNDLNG